LCQVNDYKRFFHTWVKMSYSCADLKDNSCSLNTPQTQWTHIGYERSGGGSLRDETQNAGGVYQCSSWVGNSVANQVAMAANAKQERQAIDGLIRQGWKTAPYVITAGLTDFACDPDKDSYKPRSKNVCWTFTCAYSAYLKQVLGVLPKDASSSQLNVRSVVQVPQAWTCPPQQYGGGDGCQCKCGTFDPDCEPMTAVPTDCPNHDDICIPGPDVQSLCRPRHEVRIVYS
jgi:hypothetical protein